jgi:nitroreductase
MTERSDTDTPSGHRAALPGASLDQLFLGARTYNAFEPEAIAQALVKEIYELAKWGPTASNCNPGRFVFLTTPEARARLAPHMSSSNRPKTLAAPVNVIMAYDLNFAEKVPFLFPHKPEAAAWFAKPEVAMETAFRNGSLQAAYLMLAARSLGLDCGPMSGFKEQGVNDEFFKGTSWRANFICNIGHGTAENLFPRLPRLPFDEACQVL